MGISFLYYSEPLNQAQDVVKNKNSAFNFRMPTNFKKANQYINIDIDYEKLPARNEIRLIGRVRADQLSTETLDYKWTLKNNLKLKSGSKTGKLDLTKGNEVFIDVEIKDMKKRVDVRLEATVHAKKVKVGSSKSFSYDPTKAETVEAIVEPLPKQQALERELRAPRKISAQQ